MTIDDEIDFWPDDSSPTVDGRRESCPCPICGAEMAIYRDYLNGQTCEESYSCPANHYDYVFSYGAYRETVGEREWTWSHSESDERQVAREAEIAREIEARKA